MASYTLGTIAVTNGSKAVVGTSTLWQTYGITAGDQLYVQNANGLQDGYLYEVASVTDETHLTLVQNYQGTTASGKSYRILNTAGNQTTPNFASRLSNFMASISGGASSTVKGMSKLYNALGQNTDGSVTQKVVTDAIGGTYDLTNWADIRAAIVAGSGEELFPAGYIMPVVTHSTYGDLYWEVQKNYVTSEGKHRCQLWLKYGVSGLSSIQYDGAEAFYYASAALPAGTYNFTVASTQSSWAAGTYQFTLTTAVPAKGQLKISGNYTTALTSLTVQSFSSQTATTATESVAITSGSSGTSLGTLGTELNHVQRISYGSNNWKESAMRQFLNSAAAAGSVWTPQTKFDRPPSWQSTLVGFLKGLPQDFLSAVALSEIKTYTNSVFESPDSTTPKNSVYTTKDRFYLPSRMEVYGSSEGSYPDGTTQFEPLVGSTNADKIKTLYNGTKLNSYWLRSPHTSHAYTMRIEYTPSGGALGSNHAYNSSGVVPACEIGA